MTKEQGQLFDPSAYDEHEDENPPSVKTGPGFGPRELLRDIESVWGPYGGHADLFKWMWRKLDELLEPHDG